MRTEIVREPVYQQLHDVLRKLAQSAGFPEGSRFLTERQIAERYQVSRATANKSLANLVAAQVLEFRKGIGTFVRGKVIDYDLRALVSFTEKAATAGVRPVTRVLRFDRLAAGSADAAALNALGEADSLFYIERLRLADHRPVILERRHVAARFCPGLRKADLKGSIYRLLTDRFGLRVSGAEQTIRAISIGAGDARLLGVRTGAAGLIVESTGQLENGAALWFERTLYRGDAYEFHNQMGGIRAARPALGRLLAGD